MNISLYFSADSVPSDLAPAVIFLQVKKKPTPATFILLFTYFHGKDLMKKATNSQPMVFVLDSVDEIADDPDRNSLSWIPSSLPNNCKVHNKISIIYL